MIHDHCLGPIESDIRYIPHRVCSYERTGRVANTRRTG
jgi:hypothetical protein